LAWFAVAGAFAAGLSCVEWLPVIALWHSAGRHVLGLDVANRFYLGVSQWTNFFWPNRYGHPLTGNFNPGRGSVIYQNYWETACYIGIVPCLLLAASPLALIRRRRTFRYALFWMAVLALSIWLALGKTAWLYRIAFYVVPGVRAFHDPARFLMTASFAAALLAAMVMDRLMFRPKKRQALALVFAFVTIVLTIVDLGRFDRAIYPLKPIAEIRGAISRSVLATALLHDPVLAQRNGRVMMVDSERPWSYFTSYKSFRDKEDGFLARWVDTGVPNLLMSSGILEAGAYEPLAPAVPQRRAYIVQHSPIFPSKIAGSMAVEQVIAFRPHPLAIQPSLVRLKAFHTADNVDNIYYYRNLDYQPRVRFVDARNGEVADPKVTGTPIIIEERPDILNVEIPPSLVARTLVVADNCYPGWRALLDSEQTPILETSDGFRKVRVPATMDTTTLSFVYRPMVFLLGLFVTLTTLFMLMMRIGTTLARSSFKARSGSGRPSGEGGWLFPSVPIPGQDDGDAAPDSPGDDDPGPGTHGADDGGLIEWRPGSGTLSDSGSHMS